MAPGAREPNVLEYKLYGPDVGPVLVLGFLGAEDAKSCCASIAAPRERARAHWAVRSSGDRGSIHAGALLRAMSSWFTGRLILWSHPLVGRGREQTETEKR